MTAHDQLAPQPPPGPSATHPDHAARVRRIGTVAGLPVEVLALESAAVPWAPRPGLAVNSPKTWARVGAAPWTRVGRSTGRARAWLDPEGSPWALDELVGVLEDGDWPGGMPDPERLGAARKRAAMRYAALAVGR